MPRFGCDCRVYSSTTHLVRGPTGALVVIHLASPKPSDNVLRLCGYARRYLFVRKQIMTAYLRAITGVQRDPLWTYSHRGDNSE